MNRGFIFIDRYKIQFSILFMIITLILIYYSIISGQLWLKWDVYDAAFPLYVAESDALKAGELPLWEPFVYRGVPLSHLIGVSVWFPLTIILGFIGYTQYLMQIQYLILIILAGIFMYISLYNMVKSPWLSMIGGIAYATCGQFVSNAQHLTFIVPMVLFPLLHFAFRKWYRSQGRERIKWSVLMGITLGMFLLNNYPPFLFVSVIYILVEYILFLKQAYSNGDKYKTFVEHFKSALIVFAVTCLTGSASLFTTLEIFGQITREKLSWELASGASLNPWYWFSFISPVFAQIIHASRFDISLSMSNIYIALPIILIAIFKKPTKKYEFFLLSIILFSILLVMGKYGFVYKIFYDFVPSMDAFKFPAGLRYFYFYYIILMSILNIHSLSKENKELYNFWRKNVLSFFSVTLGITLVFVILMYIFKVNTIDIPRYTVLELGISFILIISLKFFGGLPKKYFIVYLSALIIVFSFMGVLRNQNFTIGTVDRPDSFQEEITNLYNESGSKDLDNYFVEPNTNSTIYREQFQTSGYVGSFELKKFNEATESNEIPLESDPVVFALEKDWVIETGNVLATNNGNLVQMTIPQKINYTPNKFSSDIVMNEEGYVVLQQTYFNGWRAFVNDAKVDIKEFTGGVMAVKVEPGLNHIVFEFKPIGTIIAVWVSFVSWFLLIVYGSYLFYKNQRKRITLGRCIHEQIDSY